MRGGDKMMVLSTVHQSRYTFLIALLLMIIMQFFGPSQLFYATETLRREDNDHNDNKNRPHHHDKEEGVPLLLPVDTEEENVHNDNDDSMEQNKDRNNINHHQHNLQKEEEDVQVKVKEVKVNDNDDDLLVVQANDMIYKGQINNWDASPIVIDKYKLIFFAIPKVACTTWKQAFRRMMGYPNWMEQEGPYRYPYNPNYNGLKYLYNYTRHEANYRMTSSEYTRAIFVRDPKQRLISAFLDKAMDGTGSGLNGTHIINKCCNRKYSNGGHCWPQHHGPNRTLLRFMKDILEPPLSCKDEHWMPQSQRMELKYWKYINFVGHFETLQQDSHRLLTKINAWDEIGSSGWGRTGQDPIFTTNTAHHATGSQDRVMWMYNTLQLEKRVERYYKQDYENSILNLTKQSGYYYNLRKQTVQERLRKKTNKPTKN